MTNLLNSQHTLSMLQALIQYRVNEMTEGQIIINLQNNFDKLISDFMTKEPTLSDLMQLKNDYIGLHHNGLNQNFCLNFNEVTRNNFIHLQDVISQSIDAILTPKFIIEIVLFTNGNNPEMTKEGFIEEIKAMYQPFQENFLACTDDLFNYLTYANTMLPKDFTLTDDLMNELRKTFKPLRKPKQISQPNAFTNGNFTEDHKMLFKIFRKISVDHLKTHIESSTFVFNPSIETSEKADPAIPSCETLPQAKSSEHYEIESFRMFASVMPISAATPLDMPIELDIHDGIRQENSNPPDTAIVEEMRIEEDFNCDDEGYVLVPQNSK